MFPLPGISLAFKSGAHEHCHYSPSVLWRPPVPHIWDNSVNLSRAYTELFHGPERRPPRGSVRVCPWRGSCGRQDRTAFPGIPCSSEPRGFALRGCVGCPTLGKPPPYSHISSKPRGVWAPPLEYCKACGNWHRHQSLAPPEAWI